MHISCCSSELQASLLRMELTNHFALDFECHPHNDLQGQQWWNVRIQDCPPECKKKIWDYTDGFWAGIRTAEKLHKNSIPRQSVDVCSNGMFKE